MKKVDLETIYPQAEKDKEGERLRRLCEIQEGQKTISCDGTHLLRELSSPRATPENTCPENTRLEITCPLRILAPKILVPVDLVM